MMSDSTKAQPPEGRKCDYQQPQLYQGIFSTPDQLKNVHTTPLRIEGLC
jgi:hypothetical protein